MSRVTTTGSNPVHCKGNGSSVGRGRYHRAMTKAAHPSVTLLWGEDAFLLREAALQLLGDLRTTEVDAGEWQGGELQDLATPSLFGEPRALLVTDCRSLSKDAVGELAAYLSAPDPTAPLVLACTTAERGKPPAARTLVDTLGEDIGQLAAALEQLQGAFQDQQVTPKQIHQQFRGLGEQKSWDLCDRAFGKDLPGAIRSLRSIEEGGDDALMVLGAIAARLRDLMRVRALPDRLPPAQLVKAAGLRFEWQARRYQQQARNFSLEQLVAIHQQVAETDRALKSGAPGDVVMPVLIASIAA